jgi:predicted permease
MSILDLFSLQGSLFIMILAGLIMKKLGILDENGRKTLTDLCVDIVIPSNIIKSFLVQLDKSALLAAAAVLVIGFIIQFLCLFLNRFLYNGYPETQKKVLQYSTLVSNGGFLGNPVAEGVYGTEGLMYAAVYLIPMRVIMWSAGTTYFVADQKTDKKKILKNVLTHPCLVGVYIGIFIMMTGIRLPSMLVSAIRSIGSCNSALTMFIIGMILDDVPLRTILNRTTAAYSVLRLGLLPLAAYLLCFPFSVTGAARGVTVLMTGMPAGATTAIFAAKYNSDAPFAARCVILSILLSMITLPLWSAFLL